MGSNLDNNILNEDEKCITPAIIDIVETIANAIITETRAKTAERKETEKTEEKI